MHAASLVHGDASAPGVARGPVGTGRSAAASAEVVATRGGAGAARECAGAPHASELPSAAPMANRTAGAKSEAFRMISRAGVPLRRQMRQPSILLVLALAAGVPLGCARGEPPQWDAGAGISLASVPLSIDAGAATVADAAVAARSAAPSGDAIGKLPQTHARPEPSGPVFDARVQALFDAIARDDVDLAMPFFFPLTAYAQVKAIANPAADWKARLVSHYARDIHALHAKLGPNAARARFVATDVPMDRARWVEPGEEYNRIGYFRVYGTKLRGDLDGTPIAIDVTSLISWRGEWFVVHLTGVK
jgi:hypothetical protein